MSGDPLTTLWILWGCVTAALAGLLIYRSLIGMKEDDQLFLNAASPNESPLVAEQQAVVMHGHSPLGVVILDIQRLAGPVAPAHVIGSNSRQTYSVS